jgi:hypothetical protein
VLKFLWTAAALGTAITATPAVSDPPANPVARKVSASSSFPEAVPLAALLSGVMLVAISNRRRSLQRVLC